MQKFETLSKPQEMDFYTISSENGVKTIHILGYLYQSDCYWANMECVGFIMPLKEFIDNLRNNDNFIEEKLQEVKQYQRDYTEEQAVQIINGYFNGHPAENILPYKEIDENTPCGNYVC